MTGSRTRRFTVHASVLFALAAITLAAQTQSSVANIPRTPEGKPDFSGVWTGFISTPMERRAGVPEFISREEMLKELQADQKQRIDARSAASAPNPTGGPPMQSYNTLWRDGYWQDWDKVVTLPRYRTYHVIDPPDGRLPALTPRAQELLRARKALRNRVPEGPEDLPIWSGRCVRGMVSGPPLRASGAYNVYQHVVQGSDTFAVIQEMNHETQIVPLDGSAHPPDSVRLLKGDSRGRWDGDTLVIDTTNFVGATVLNAGVMSVGNDGLGGGTTSEKLHVVERYTVLDANNILYRATVEDPETHVKPYTMEFVMYRVPDQKQLVEYACHEGNRALEYILSGARALEAKGIKDPVYFKTEEQEKTR